MLIKSRDRRRARRGIILVLVLAILGMMALIGITFATITGQSRISARNYTQSTLNPLAADMMDYALSQLLGDTDDIRSAIRGHSMARDMYGNDALNNGYLASNLSTASNGLLQFQSAVVFNSGTDPKNGLIQCVTTIPLNDTAYYGYDFTRWIVRFQPTYTLVASVMTYLVGQSYEVVIDDTSGTVNPNYRVFYLAPPPANLGYHSQAPTTVGTYVSPEIEKSTTTAPKQSILCGEYAGIVYGTGVNVPLNATPFDSMGFILDGRYLRAFNGPGAGSNASAANFRYNGPLLTTHTTGTNYPPPNPGDPNVVGLDEDYDACDLENWFLALQSADGKIIVPSFHRPGIVSPLDWSSKYNSSDAEADQLFEIQAMSRILRPRKTDGHDAATFPDLRPDPSTGNINFDVDNDGDGITDSVWVDLGYPARQDSRGLLYKPLFAFMVIGLNGRIPLNTAGNLHLGADGGGGRFGMHTSHLGNSPSEVDPSFGLQNAVDQFYPGPENQLDNAGVATTGAATIDASGHFFKSSPGDAEVSVNVTQLRNILTGTRPPLERNPAGLPTMTSASGDANWVLVNGQFWNLPNNVPDGADVPVAGTTVNRPPGTVAGRWGEQGYIPSGLSTNVAAVPNPVLSFSNLIRAGVSGYLQFGKLQDLGDARDDNFNAYDFWPSPAPSGSFNGGEAEGPSLHMPASYTWPADYYDAAGGLNLPVERMRRFVTPIDATGDGSVRNFTTQADNGSDTFGRVTFNRYYRPPGVPTTTTDFSGGTTGVAAIPDTTNNRLHGYEAQRNPDVPGVSRELDYAGAPADLDGTGAQTVDGSGNPTAISGGFRVPTFNSVVNTLARSININEADEMKLYETSSLDAPFGHGDLEWLYRDQDRDGGTLHSRLADLAPISFTNPIDGLRRRRLYSIDSWESTGMVWTPDNPRNQFPDNSVIPSPNANFISVGAPLLTTNGGLYSLFSQTQSLYTNTGTTAPSPDLTTNPAQTVPVSTAISTLMSTTPSYAYSGGVSLAHRDRKINLNYPLPVSNSPDEPIRKKWIAESYNFLKKSLPPLSVKYPEQLAQLSQYLINIIDFRDPDATMTHWVNPDVVLVPGDNTVTPNTAPYLSFATAVPPGAPSIPLDQYGMEYNPVALNEVLAYSYPYYTGSATSYQGRFFVELVNTLTSPQANSIVGGVNPSALNLSRTGAYEPGNPYAHGAWDLVFTADDPESRPDPFRGLLADKATAPQAKWYGLIPLTREAFNQTTDPYDVTLLPLNSASNPLGVGGNNTSIPAPTPGTATEPPKNYFYVIGDTPTAPEEGTPATGLFWPASTTIGAGSATTPKVVSGIQAATLTQGLATNFDPMNGAAPGSYPFKVYAGVLPGASNPDSTNPQGLLPTNYNWKIPQLTAPGTISYYWVCLRRPANPFAAVSASNPMIVVDAVRFPYVEGSGPLVTNSASPPPQIPNLATVNTVYSVQRLQPFRGGHAVPYLAPPTAAGTAPNAPLLTPAPSLDARYGFTEQIVSPASSGWSASTLHTRGIYSNSGTTNYATGSNGVGVYHTLGWANEVTENWDYFPFHDRDFTSIGELTLVPGCPPGLFTMQFAENAPVTGFANSTARIGTAAPGTPFAHPVPPPAPTSASTALGATPTFPYLVDRFFYTSASPSTPAGNNATSPGWDPVYGPVSGGWHKMFEFFEVPSPAVGATGSVANGSNYDWFRQDSRPGLLNLNLIIDEEVFLGLMGNAGARTDQPLTTPIAGHTYTLQQVVRTPSKLNSTPLPAAAADPSGMNAGAGYTPQMVNEWDYSLNQPTILSTTQWAAHPVTNTGFYDSITSSNTLKSCFSDFLKLRYGGTGYMFGPTSDSPFRSLSYPDIDKTLMRPAFPADTARVSGQDAGVKNYAVAKHSGATVYPPAIPPRRLLQIPDNDSVPTERSTASLTPRDNTALGYAPNPIGSLQVAKVDLSSGSATPANWISGNKRHPYFRSEWMQKMMNLSTVRTHQYAVWITVGFFEVRKQGDPTLAWTNPAGAYDTIGREIGLPNGKQVRYRAFFIVDRLRLGGFDPRATGNYRDAVIYRNIIE